MGKLDKLKGDLDLIKTLMNWIYGFLFVVTNATGTIFISDSNSILILVGLLIDLILFITLFVAFLFYVEKNNEIGETKENE